MPSILLAVSRAKLAAKYAKELARVARETGARQPDDRHQSKLPGDEQALRGIPAIGRGVQGAIPRTRPGDNLE